MMRFLKYIVAAHAQKFNSLQINVKYDSLIGSEQIQYHLSQRVGIIFNKHITCGCYRQRLSESFKRDGTTRRTMTLLTDIDF